MVATTLNKPVATRSISASICCSVEEGEFRSAYAECVVRVGVAVSVGEDGVAVLTGGRRENNDGEGAMKERYWSKTWKKVKWRSRLLKGHQFTTHLLHIFTCPVASH